MRVIPPSVIDRDGLHRSNLRGMREALCRLCARPPRPASSTASVSGRRRPSTTAVVRTATRRAPPSPPASVVAKVVRDRSMHRLDALYPHYGFRPRRLHHAGHSAVVESAGRATSTAVRSRPAAMPSCSRRHREELRARRSRPRAARASLLSPARLPRPRREPRRRKRARRRRAPRPAPRRLRGEGTRAASILRGSLGEVGPEKDGACAGGRGLARAQPRARRELEVACEVVAVRGRRLDRVTPSIRDRPGSVTL